MGFRVNGTAFRKQHELKFASQKHWTFETFLRAFDHFYIPRQGCIVKRAPPRTIRAADAAEVVLIPWVVKPKSTTLLGKRRKQNSKMRTAEIQIRRSLVTLANCSNHADNTVDSKMRVRQFPLATLLRIRTFWAADKYHC